MTNDADTKLPTVTLDVTLADLYRQSSSSLANKHIGQVLSGFSSAMALTPGIPRNRKYIYQDGPFTTGDVSPDMGASTAVKYLSLVTQRDAFISGAAPAIFFNLTSSPEKQMYDRAEVEKTLAVLPESQRPLMFFCDGPRDVPIEEAGIDYIACKGAMDDLERYNNVVPLETHWFLNSKGALAASELPTPKCDTLAIEGFPIDASACCFVCDNLEADEYIIPDDCLGPRGTWLTEQSARLYRALESRSLPFVLKNQETFGGAGTYLVRTEDERQETISTLRKGLLRRMLSTVTPLNAHMGPATLLISDMVEELVGDYGLTFFVTEKGRDNIFLGASKQIIENGKSWIGSTIDYRKQSELWDKFHNVASQTAEFLRSHGYIGPAGADILETADGLFHVVDLNVRVTGSLCLPLLKGHFVSRGLNCAASLSINVSRRRTEFLQLFAEEFADGSMCILSWYEDQATGRSMADVALGAKDEKGLTIFMRRVKEVSSNVTF